MAAFHLIDGLKAGARVMFNYNAAEDKGRRQAPQKSRKHESKILTRHKRKKLQATADEQLRNHALPAWMVRKHLDYVSKFHMSFRTGKQDIDTLVNRIFKWHGSPRNLDFGRRFGRDEMFRLFELEKVVAGDAGLIKLQGIKLQPLESDMIAKPTTWPDGKTIDNDLKVRVNDSGLIVDDAGRVEKMCICNRGPNGNGIVFDHLEDVDNVIFDAYWSRFSSQFRGVSPLSTAINMVQDIHESFEYNVLKAKMHALFGVAIMRGATGTEEFGGAAGATAETESADETDTDTHLDLDPRSINLLDLGQDDDVKTIESTTPSTQFVQGSYLFIQIAMLALDIPITCFDSRRSSFSARIADLNEYEVSADSKRTKNRYVRQEYSDWVLAEIWNDPQTPWPLRKVAGTAGMSLRDVQEAVNWISSGSPWLDKYKQLQGDQLAISLGEDNAIDATRRRGGDVFDNIDKQAQVLEYARQKGVPIAAAQAKDKTIQELVADEMQAQREAEESDAEVSEDDSEE